MIIPLSQGKQAIVDDEDYARITAMGRWTYHSGGYAYKWQKIDGKKTCVLMHRVVVDTPKGLVTDHINGDKLDNRKSNLKVTDNTGNQTNLHTTGAERNSQSNSYLVRPMYKGRRIYLGYFKDKEEADQIYYNIKQQLMELHTI